MGSPLDNRSYRVDRTRFAELAPGFGPRVTLDRSIQRLKAGLEGMGLADKDFRNASLIRLKVLEGHIDRRDVPAR
jgi:hypothetical protein